MNRTSAIFRPPGEWDIFDCNNPAHADMQNLLKRLSTFELKWPSRHTQATPGELALAGFYFVENPDRVACFYCNGGLQNWNYFDDPWHDHARWYPKWVKLQITESKLWQQLIDINANENDCRTSFDNAYYYFFSNVHNTSLCTSCM